MKFLIVATISILFSVVASAQYTTECTRNYSGSVTCETNQSGGGFSVDPFAFQRGQDAEMRRQMEMSNLYEAQQDRRVRREQQMRNEQIAEEQMRQQQMRQQQMRQEQMRQEQMRQEQMRQQQMTDDAYAEQNAPEWQEGIFVRRELAGDGALCFYKPPHGDVFVKGKRYREFTGRVTALGECPRRLLIAKSTAFIHQPAR